MKQQPRVVELRALGGLLTGRMVLPLGIDHIELPIPPSVTLRPQSVMNSDGMALEVDVTGPDTMIFESIHRFNIIGADAVEIFEAVSYGKSV